MVYLRNLNSSECFDGTPPWRFTSLALVPSGAFKDKALRDGWINTPTTSFNVYSMYEGVQSNLRLRGAQVGGDDNPPLLFRGLAVDYDTAMRVEDVVKALPLMSECPPNWFEQTLSGNGRLVWVFERPIRLPSRKFLLRVLEKLHDVIPFRKLPMIDESALKAPERYFTNGCRWTLISRARVPYAKLYGAILRISEKFDWQQKEFGKAVSLADIAAECRRVFPRFADWPGDFTLGATGPSFWIDGSTSPKSAIVRETGIQTFAAHATKAFYSWAEIVGSSFVETNESERLGRAVDGIWYDGRSFITKDATGRFAFHNKDNMRMLLQGSRGLKNNKPKDGGLSEVDQALVHVLQQQCVEGAASCAFFPHGTFTYGGRRVLNTHQIEVMKPADAPSAWGDAGKFPFVSKFLDGFFSPVEPQRDRFLAWFQYHYLACLSRHPVSGHGVFIAGPVGCGKTFLNRGILGSCLGGYAEANSYLISSDNFNSELFDYGLWVIDDGSVASSDRVHQLFTENVKRTVANQDHRTNEKFRKAVMVPWMGRIVVTLNCDAQSVRLIPNVDASILEKLIILRAGERAVQFLPQAEMVALLQRELPWFLRWLVDWAPPAHCYEGAEVRFGIASYAEPSLLRAANLSSGKSVFVEILTRWLSEYFTGHPTETAWQGTATELRMAMIADLIYSELLRSYRPEQFPRMLVEAMNKGVLDISVDDADGVRRFSIARVSAKLAAPPEAVPQATNSNFQKV